MLRQLDPSIYGPTNLPIDLVYEPASRTYFSPSTGLAYVKAGGGTVRSISLDELKVMRSPGQPAVVTVEQLQAAFAQLTPEQRDELFAT